MDVNSPTVISVAKNAILGARSRMDDELQFHPLIQRLTFEGRNINQIVIAVPNDGMGYKVWLSVNVMQPPRRNLEAAVSFNPTTGVTMAPARLCVRHGLNRHHTRG